MPTICAWISASLTAVAASAPSCHVPDSAKWLVSSDRGAAYVWVPGCGGASKRWLRASPTYVSGVACAVASLDEPDELARALDGCEIVLHIAGAVGFDSPIALFSTYAGTGATLRPWLADAAINSDRNLRLQYLAAAGLNSYRSEAIFNQLAAYRRFPDSLFVADEAWKGRLRAAMHVDR